MNDFKYYFISYFCMNTFKYLIYEKNLFQTGHMYVIVDINDSSFNKYLFSVI